MKKQTTVKMMGTDRRVSADVNHGKQWGPVALPGSNQQHPATQTVSCEAHARAPDDNNFISSDHGSPGCSEDSPVERPEAGQRHENGNHGGQSVESAVCERLRGGEDEHCVQYLPFHFIFYACVLSLTTATASDSSSSAGVIMVK
ncbi:hypothetical protein EYF80_020993 [Liparis tanakae]|uniref:Uncharacterized protein n=1 Tax=Liparis tanakae TaxID=230148 RepID=A0A4Z2HU06_9TELE|nr:hypothetical protein EYF80_020993 [Liparis tanakae]